MNSELKVFNSSLFMFNHIKGVIKRANEYSRNQVMFDIFNVIKKALRTYIREIEAKINKEKSIRFKDESYYESLLCNYHYIIIIVNMMI